MLFRSIQELSKLYEKTLRAQSEPLKNIIDLLKIFPGLVLPLELREESGLVHKALKAPAKEMNISRMLMSLERITGGKDVRHYVRGFVLSQTESADDISAGVRLSKKYLGKAVLPVVPLFESAHSLSNSVTIIEEYLANKTAKDTCLRYWDGQLEVMLGYSDSAKENGSFSSRFLIFSAISELDRVISQEGLKPIFFHGSGGSIERGGGSIREQIQWWPPSALAMMKMTMQGEMIYRNYASHEITQRQLDLLFSKSDEVKEPTVLSRQELSLLKRFADSTQKAYRDIVSTPSFMELIELATPYPFLKDLRLGSRPSKRQTTVDLKSLRAIPWVLCWTQTRCLFSTWWGVGTFWESLNQQEQDEYRNLFLRSPLFSSYIKQLGFTLEKANLDIFSFYLSNSKLSDLEKTKYIDSFREEFTKSRHFVLSLTKQSSLIWYRPWLEKSIYLRSPLIHPLSVLQVIALERNEILLLRETVTGIASGMLTTG